jgi:dihydrofolate reductase
MEKPESMMSTNRMRKILLNLAVSLDGFVEGPRGEFDRCLTDQDYGMSDFLRRVDAILFGRRSYEALVKFDPNPYPDKKKYVFSRTLTRLATGFELIGSDIEASVKDIRGQPGSDIWLFGGPEFVSHLINAELVEEMHLAVHPLLLGAGKPLFQRLTDSKGLDITGSTALRLRIGAVVVSPDMTRGLQLEPDRMKSTSSTTYASGPVQLMCGRA